MYMWVYGTKLNTRESSIKESKNELTSHINPDQPNQHDLQPSNREERDEQVLHFLAEDEANCGYTIPPACAVSV